MNNSSNMVLRNSLKNKVKNVFSDTGLIMKISIAAVIILIIVFLFVRLSYDIKNYTNDAPYLIEDTIRGSDTKVISGTKLIRSYDQKFGLEFSYVFWIYIDENTFSNSGKYHHIFHKGNASAVPLQAPGVWIYPSENKLAINMNSFNKVKNSCDVGNIPLNKWVLIGITVIGDTMDVFINAKLKKRCKLDGIPMQNYGDLYIGKWGGFNGFLSRFRYFSYAVPFYRLEKMFQEGPSDAPCEDTGQAALRLAPTYWMTTGQPDTQINI